MLHSDPVHLSNHQRNAIICFFFFNDTATTEIYTLSLHDALPISLLATLLPIALAYGPRSPNPAALAVRFNWAVSYLIQERGLDHELGVLLSHLWLPRALRDLINGVVAVKAHNDSGHLSYLLGDVGLMGGWSFYLVGLAVKTPIPLLAAGPAGLAWLAP